MKLIIEVTYEYYLECNKFVRQKMATLDQYVIASGIEYKEPKKGTWELVDTSEGTHFYGCSECQFAGDISDRFCRRCGAKMENEGEATQLYDIVDDIDDKFMRGTENMNRGNEE